MGVLGLWQLLAPVGQPVSLESLENKIFAVDISIWLNQALKGYRDSQGGSVPNAHLMSLFTRLCKLMFYRIRPIFVFDGAVPELKKQTVINRQHRRDIIKQNCRQAGLKLLASYMTSQTLKSKKENSKKNLADAVPLSRSKQPKDDIFLLPPLPTEVASDDDLAKIESGVQLGSLPKEEMKYLSKIDIESEEFAALPLDIKLEILSSLKENRRHRTWEEHKNLPDDSHDFSSYQLQCLLKRRTLQKKVEEVKSEMRKTSSADIISLYDTDDHVLEEASKIMSEDSAHYILLKKVVKSSDDKLIVAKGSSASSAEDVTVPVKAKQTMSDQNLDHNGAFDDVHDAEFSSGSESIPNVRPSGAKLSGDSSCDKNVGVEMECYKNTDCTPCVVVLETIKIKPDDCANISNCKSDEIQSIKGQGNVDSRSDADLGAAEESVTLSETDDDSGEEAGNLKLPSLEEGGGIKQSCSESLNFRTSPSRSEISPKVFRRASDESASDSENIELASSNESKGVTNVTCSSNILPRELSETVNLSYDSEPCGSSGSVHAGISEKSTDDVSMKIDMRDVTFSSDSEAISDEEASIAVQYELAASQAALEAQQAKQQRQANTIQEHMYEECQELLRLFGVPYINSPTEAEAQCAFLDSANVTHGTITDDSDIWLFGGKRVYKNFFAQNKFVEFYKDNEILSHFRLTRNKLINFALLTGSDYTEGIEGVGPVTAMEILSEFSADGIEAMHSFKEWWDTAQKHSSPPKNKIRSKLQKLSLSPGFPSTQVYEAYLKPVVDESMESFTWGRPDLDALRDYTKEKFGWNRSRVDDTLLPVIKRLNERTAQTHLDSFFTISLRKEDNLFPSKRIMSALKKLHEPVADSNSEDAGPQKKNARESKRKAGVSQKTERAKKAAKVFRGKQRRRQVLPKKAVPDSVCLSEESSNDSMECI